MRNLTLSGWARPALVVCLLFAMTVNGARAQTKRYVSVMNGTPAAIGVRFTQPSSGEKVVSEGSIGPFNSKSFAMAPEFATVRITAKGCATAARDVPLGKNVIVKEGCVVEVQ